MHPLCALAGYQRRNVHTHCTYAHAQRDNSTCMHANKHTNCATEVKDRSMEALGTCGGEWKGRWAKVSKIKKRWWTREAHEEGENGKKGSNGYKKCLPLFIFFLPFSLPKMAVLNRKILQQSPLTLPCLWCRPGCDRTMPPGTLTVYRGFLVSNARHSRSLEAHKRKQRGKKWH